MEDPAAKRHTEFVGSQRGNIGELTVVFGITVVLPSLLWAAAQRGVSFEFGQTRLLTTVAGELIAVSLLWPWLHSRGWSFRSIAGTPEPTDILRGVGVALVAYVAYYLSAVTWAAFVPGAYEAMELAVPVGTAAPWVVVLVAVVNPVVEEFLWLGYGITALRRFGSFVAVAVSVALRVSVHLYQGPMAIIGILPLGLAFTIYFVRTKRLWPVVVAHLLFDAIGLLSVVK